MSWAPVLSLIGPTGMTGPQGTSVNPRGQWLSETQYNLNDTVVSTLDLNSYVCITATVTSSDDPSTDPTNWVLYQSLGPTGNTGPAGTLPNTRGLWVSSETYAVNDVVISLADGNTYICINPLSNNPVDPASDPESWTLYAARGPTGPVGSQIYGLGYSPQGTLDYGVAPPAGATGPPNASVYDIVFDLQNGLVWQPKRWDMTPSDDFDTVGATGDYYVNTQSSGMPSSSALLAPVSSITYNLYADSVGPNNLVGKTGHMIVGWGSDMSSQISLGDLYINGAQVSTKNLSDGATFGNTGATQFQLGLPWGNGANVVVFKPSTPISFVPDLFLTLDSANFQLPPV